MPESTGTIPIAKPWLGEEEAEAARRPILSGWVMQGPEVAAFEGEFAAAVGAPHACAVSSGTTALHLALLAVGVAPGDEVVTVSHSYIATANAVRHCGATPVFVDIDPLTFNMSPALVEPALTSRTRAILCVHQMGMPCDLAAIFDIARRRRLPVVEDAACATGSEIRWNGSWQRIGRPQADVACFSFHPRKVITTGDGGMITTPNAEYDQLSRSLRNHGMAPAAPPAYPRLGYNYRMTDIQAAVGREQLKRLPEIVRRRRRLAARYADLLGDLPGLQLPTEPPYARSNWQSYCVRLPDRCDPPSVMERMLASGVSTRPGIMCAHREGAYADLPPRFPLPESEAAQDRCITLPLYAQLTDPEQNRAAEALADACRRT